MSGKTCAGTLVTGLGKDGAPRKTYLYHVVDNEWSMREYGSQAVVWQTALNPAVALELLAEGAWQGVGVLGPEAFPPQPFLDKLAEFGSPHGMLELTPATHRPRPGEAGRPLRLPGAGEPPRQAQRASTERRRNVRDRRRRRSSSRPSRSPRCPPCPPSG